MRRFSSVPSSLGVYENGTDSEDCVGARFTLATEVTGDDSLRCISGILKI